MGKRVPIKEVASGKIFKTMSAAEREYGIKEGTISWLIDKGEPINGHLFVRVSDDASEPEVACTYEPEVVDTDASISNPFHEVMNEEHHSDVIATSAFTQDSLVSYLRSHGYTADIENNVVMVYDINTAEKVRNIRELIFQLGYTRSWGWSPLLSRVQETGKPYGVVEQ